MEEDKRKKMYIAMIVLMAAIIFLNFAANEPSISGFAVLSELNSGTNIINIISVLMAIILIIIGFIVIVYNRMEK